MSKNKYIFILSLICICLIACSPYRGFRGVDKKGMKRGTLPSQQLKGDYEKLNKRAQRKYRREMKKNYKRLGTPEGQKP